MFYQDKALLKHAKNGIDVIDGLKEELNESVLIKKKPIYGICAGMQLFATKGHEEEDYRRIKLDTRRS